MVPSQLNRVLYHHTVYLVSLTWRPPQVTRVPWCSRVTVTRPGLDNVNRPKRQRSVTDHVRDSLDILTRYVS